MSRDVQLVQAVQAVQVVQVAQAVQAVRELELVVEGGNRWWRRVAMVAGPAAAGRKGDCCSGGHGGDGNWLWYSCGVAAVWVLGWVLRLFVTG